MDQRSAITRDGRRLTYGVVGAGPLLVCHPGGPGLSGAYLEDLAGLARTRTLVFVNPAGTGGSDPWAEEAYSLDVRAGGVDDLRAALAEERIDYLGHSAGGFVGVRYAARYPERVRRLLLVGTITRFTDDLRAALARQRRLHEHEPWFEDAVAAQGRRMAREYADEAEFQALYERAFPLMFASYRQGEQEFMRRLRGTGLRCDRRTLDSFNDEAASFDLRPDLPRISAETLIVNGELDGVRALERELLDAIPDARLAVIESAGHFPFVEQPERFHGAVLEFLGVGE